MKIKPLKSDLTFKIVVHVVSFYHAVCGLQFLNCLKLVHLIEYEETFKASHQYFNVYNQRLAWNPLNKDDKITILR